MRIKEALKFATYKLNRAGVYNSRFEAELLLSYVMGARREVFYLSPSIEISKDKEAKFRKSLELRLKRVPFQYICGSQPFRCLDLKIAPGVFIPRPETEILVEKVLEAVKNRASFSFLDIGTGSGAIAISLAYEFFSASGYALDNSFEALSCALFNARKHGVDKKIKFLFGDIFEDFSLPEKVDVVASNPPYVARDEFAVLSPEVLYEPYQALYGGEDGLKFYRRIIELSPFLLKKGGILALEVGKDKHEIVRELIETSGKFRGVEVFADFNGIKRVVLAYFEQ